MSRGLHPIINSKNNKTTCLANSLRTDMPSSSQKSRLGKVILLNDPMKSAKKDPIPETRLIKQHIREQNEEALIRTFCVSIEKYARQKKFTIAGKLREKLIELVPMALTEIVQTGEIIEREKSQALDPERMKPFADLYRQLSESEAIALFSALIHMEVPSNKPVFEQCQFDNRLYFIQSGRFILGYFDIAIRQHIDCAIIQKGDVVGSDAFFHLSCHTTTLTPIEKSGISVLHKNDYNKIIREYPGISSKLKEFCIGRKKNFNIGKSESQARRQYKRYPVDMNGYFSMSKAHGGVSGLTTAMNVVDFSAGGLCLITRNMKPEAAAELHQSWISIFTTSKNGNSGKNIKITGKVVSVRQLPFDECAIHIQFKKPIPESVLKNIT